MVKQNSIAYSTQNPIMPPNQAVQLTPLARLVGWARSTRQNAPACWRHDIPQPSGDHNHPNAPGAPAVGRTRIAWQLPLPHVLHPSHARQRRS